MGVLISDQRDHMQRLRLIIDLSNTISHSGGRIYRIRFLGLCQILDPILDLFTSGRSSRPCPGSALADPPHQIRISHIIMTEEENHMKTKALLLLFCLSTLSRQSPK